ncbi:MAG: hypothetical protein NZM37_08460, partial [Sandaracinaceae bacterium]|nr:hypothetical protein [Sandaracinaceae bacterium]
MLRSNWFILVMSMVGLKLSGCDCGGGGGGEMPDAPSRPDAFMQDAPRPGEDASQIDARPGGEDTGPSTGTDAGPSTGTDAGPSTGTDAG